MPELIYQNLRSKLESRELKVSRRRSHTMVHLRAKTVPD